MFNLYISALTLQMSLCNALPVLRLQTFPGDYKIKTIFSSKKRRSKCCARTCSRSIRTRISSPSFAGQTVMIIQAVLLAWDHSLPGLPRRFYSPSGICQACSPLQRRDRTGITPDFSIMLYSTCTLMKFLTT